MALNSQVYEAIRARIRNGEFDDGKRFSANALATSLGVSRTPVRDAVQKLESEGVLVSLPKSGLRLREYTYRECEEAFEMRLALEPFIAARAAERCDYDQANQLRQLCFRMAKAARAVQRAAFADPDKNQQLHELDTQLHLAIAAIAGNRLMQRFLEDSRPLLRKHRYPSSPCIHDLALTLLEHWRTCRAVGHGDANGAHRWMERHARRGMRRALQSYGEPPSGPAQQPASAPPRTRARGARRGREA